jgi:hypothetical protein
LAQKKCRAVLSKTLSPKNRLEPRSELVGAETDAVQVPGATGVPSSNPVKCLY